MDINRLIEFSTPYYEEKDIMHNMWHIELLLKSIDKIIHLGNYQVNKEHLIFAAYFHGFIYNHENDIRKWMIDERYSNEEIEKIISISLESQRPEIPISIEWKIIHDAHILEGGKTYLAVKSLITGSVRGQTLIETINYIENYVLNKNECYLPETIPLCEKMNKFTINFINDLKLGIE